MLRLATLVFLLPLVWSARLPDNAENEIFTLDSTDDDNDTECLLEDRTIGICVPYYLCYGNKTLIDDGATLIDFRSSSGCRQRLEKCCYRSTSDAPSVSIPNPQKYESYSEDKSWHPTKPKEEVNIQANAECGWNNPDIYSFKKTDNDRIYAEYGEFPWIVALIGKTSDEEYLGGGSIIHPSVVLTVAHKVDLITASQIKCRGGEWNTQSTLEQYPFQERDVKKILLHPSFFKTSLYYDAALLFLETPFELGNAPHMGTACLSSVPSTPGEECFTMGWGKGFTGSDIYSDILKKVKLPIVDPASCEQQLRRTRLGSLFRLHQSFTCAGGEQVVDACQGDGGSPLVCPIKRDGDHVRYAMVGVVAYGIGSGKMDVPGLYVNISDIYPWINKEMVKEGYDYSTYRI